LPSISPRPTSPEPKVQIPSAELEIRTARMVGLAFCKLNVRDSAVVFPPSLSSSTCVSDLESASTVLTVIRIAAHRLIGFFLLCP